MFLNQAHIPIYLLTSHIINYRISSKLIRTSNYSNIIKLLQLIQKGLRNLMRMNRLENKLLFQEQNFTKHFKIIRIKHSRIINKLRSSNSHRYNLINIHNSVDIKFHRYKWTNHFLNKQFLSALIMEQLINQNFYICQILRITNSFHTNILKPLDLLENSLINLRDQEIF